jgi:hypothetical protein
MRDCPNVEMRERLPELMHGALRAAVATEVRAHVAQCAECRAELALLERVRTAFVAPTIDTSRIVAKLPAYRRPSLFTRATRSAQLRAAAAIVVLAGAFAVSRNVGDDRTAPPDTAVAVTPAAAAGREIAIGDTFQDLTDSDLMAVLEEIAQLDAVTLDADDDVPAVIERNGRGGGGGS